MREARGSVALFLRLWLLMTFSYVTLTLLFDLLGPGYVDLREWSLLRLAVVPLGQALVFWLVTRRRSAPQVEPPAS